MTVAVWTAVGALVAGLVSVRSLHWLKSEGHRYADERGQVVPSFRWLVPLSVVAGGLVFGTRVEQSPVLAVTHLGAVVLLVVLAAIDLDVRRLPDRFTKPAVPIFAVLLTVQAWVGGEWTDLRRAVLAAVILTAWYGLMVLIVPAGGLGLGDVKLMPTVGLLLGYLGWDAVLASQVVAYVFAGVHAVAILARGGSRKSTLALGPHLVAGVLTVLVAPALAALVTGG